MIGDLGEFQRRLLRWYRAHRRDLPWRAVRGDARADARADARVDPYRVLVSEAMLQQTQVATVVPYFLRFMEHFPTAAALAAAEEQAVLRLWQGLGYYSRARNLRRAAQVIVERFDGQVPATVADLLALPGVGRYTAGAIASIAHDARAPIVDGNVIRVLCRLDRVETDPRADRAALEAVWKRAEEILPAEACGDFNSALMELGATVCLPRSPACLVCPVAGHCAAREAGVQERIPPVRAARPTPLRQRLTFLVRRGEQYLMEQRPAAGRWAGMWQFVTVQHPGRTGATMAAGRASALVGLAVTAARRLCTIEHALTHRRYMFEVYGCEAVGEGEVEPPRRWISIAELDQYPLPRPHVRMLEMVSGGG